MLLQIAMVIEKIQELEKLQAQVAQLKSQVEVERTAELKSLPGKYGFGSLADFIKALKEAEAAPVKRGRKPGKAAAAPKAAKAPKAAAAGEKKKRTRAVITDETRNKVKELVDAGKTAAEIATELKISAPSVQNIKKALGLVKARAGAAA